MDIQYKAVIGALSILFLGTIVAILLLSSSHNVKTDNFQSEMTAQIAVINGNTEELSIEVKAINNKLESLKTANDAVLNKYTPTADCVVNKPLLESVGASSFSLSCKKKI